jgi:hypothetical protein
MQQDAPFNLSLVCNATDIDMLLSVHIKNKLTDYIRTLIINNPEELIQLLYRIDVREEKIASALHRDIDDAPVIAELIIERQIQKIKTRQQFKQNNNESDEERW